MPLIVLEKPPLIWPGYPEGREADAATLRQAGIELGRDYPRPIVDHGKARDRALAAFATIKQGA